MNGDKRGPEVPGDHCDWLDDREVDGERSGRRGWSDRFTDSRRLPEIVTQPRPSVLEYLDEIGRPEPGQAEVPGWRGAWARGVAVPIKIVARAFDQASEKPERFIPAVVLLLVVCTALNHVPLVWAVIPNNLDISTWF